MLRIILASFAVCLAVLVLAMIYLPWWGFLLVLVGVFAALMGVGRLLAGRIGQHLLMIPFRAKGAVLKQARAEVHSIVAVAPPDRVPGAEGDDEAAGEQDHYLIDVTVTPGPSPGPFQFWEPGELVLLPARAKVRGPADLPDGSQVSCVEVFRDGRFRPDEEGKYLGPLRLRLAVAVPRAERGNGEMAFLYYFSKFGALALPTPAPQRPSPPTAS